MQREKINEQREMRSKLLHLLVLFLISTNFTYSQKFVTGKVIHQETKEPLSGVNVVLKGNLMGVSTNDKGEFLLEVPTKIGVLRISHTGFISKEISYRFARKTPYVEVFLEENMQLLPEFVVNNQLLDVAKERKTPVAVSTIFASEINEKLGNREFPELLNRTPSVYVTKAGGYGDSNINIRGFNNENIAVTVNGVPVNDMENDRVYWSNWTGIAETASLLQIQRGLGASKLAIASIGGTLNIITRSADMREGGWMLSSFGNNYDVKTAISYNTGKSKKGFSASVLLGHTSGEKYVNGTDFESYNYYLALGYTPSEQHTLQLMMMGAPQWHNQRNSYVSIANALAYGNGKPNRKYNPDLGILNGVEYNTHRNVYHKPLFMLNWDWNISSKTMLNTTFYTSFGRGFGTQAYGLVKGQGLNSFRNVTTELYDFDQLVKENQISAPDAGTLVRGARINSHDWYGALTNLRSELFRGIVLNVGFDGRYYKGYHYAMMNDFLGATFYKDDANKNLTTNNYVSVANRNYPSYMPFFTGIDPVSNTIAYNYEGQVFWLGVFAQLEYTRENLSAFLQGSISDKGYSRTDNFLKEGTPINGTNILMPTKTRVESLLGYNVKAGVNHNIENHNIFSNIGFYSKQPNFNAVYRGNLNFPSSDNVNEKILGIELGYGFKSEKVNIKANLYRTTWKDRYERKNNLIDTDTNGTNYYAEISRLSEIHQGIELELFYKYNKYLDVNTMLSFGDWFYEGNAEAMTYETATRQPYVISGATSNRLPLLLDKTRVGGTAQVTTNVGVILTPISRFKINFDWRHINNLYANFDVYAFSDSETASKGSLKLPSYNLFDLSFSYKLPLVKKQFVTFGLNLYNLLDSHYIAESQDNIHATETNKLYKKVDVRNRVYFGFGRTYNFSFRYSF